MCCFGRMLYAFYGLVYSMVPLTKQILALKDLLKLQVESHYLTLVSIVQLLYNASASATQM